LAKSYQNIGKIYLTFAEFKFNNMESFYTAKQRKKDANSQFAVSYLEKSIKLSIKLGDSAMTQESKFYLDKAKKKGCPNQTHSECFTDWIVGFYFVFGGSL